MAGMDDIIGGLFFINGVDVWKEYGVFLTEEKEGGRENQTAILTPSKVKSHTAVNIREEDGEKYSKKLTVANEARDMTLTFALYAPSRSEWFSKYRSFIAFLKQGEDGWLTLYYPQLDLRQKVYYKESSGFKPLTSLWRDSVQASRFRVKFREPVPVI